MRYSKFLIPLVIASLSPDGSAGQHIVIHSEIDGVPLVKTEGGSKYVGALFEIEEDIVIGTDSDEPDLLVEINNNDSLKNYRKIQQFLEGLAAVRRTDLVRLDQEVVVFRIDLRGDVDDFVRLVAIDRKLEPRDYPPQPGGGAAGQQQKVLHYSYRQ